MKKIFLITASFLLLSACQTLRPPAPNGTAPSPSPMPPISRPVETFTNPSAGGGLPIALPAPTVNPIPLPPPVDAQQNGTPTACTMDYRPVCGKIAIVCITTPCDPVDETFGNECMAKARGAYDLREGECK